jgi:hypothetical protein
MPETRLGFSPGQTAPRRGAPLRSREAARGAEDRRADASSCHPKMPRHAAAAWRPPGRIAKRTPVRSDQSIGPENVPLAGTVKVDVPPCGTGVGMAST